MTYDLKNKDEEHLFNAAAIHFKALKKIVELKEIKPTRTNLQNRSLHLFFTMISDQLNELGIEYRYFGLKGQELCLMYTPELVKMFFWKPIQKSLFDFDSTKKLKSDEINQISDVIIKFFGDKGIVIEFPSLKNMKEIKHIKWIN